MTVSSLTTKNSHSGDGSTSAFPYTFKIFNEDDVTVIIRTDSTGTESPKNISSGHYTVSGVGNTNGGNVTFTSGNIPARLFFCCETHRLRRLQTTHQTIPSPPPRTKTR